jgi:hypothetical protein
MAVDIIARGMAARAAAGGGAGGVGKAYVDSQDNLVLSQAKAYVDQQTGNLVFEQPTAMVKWEVQHNLNRFPSVTVVDGTNTMVLADVKYVDENNIVINFSKPFSGKAFLN